MADWPRPFMFPKKALTEGGSLFFTAIETALALDGKVPPEEGF